MGFSIPEDVVKYNICGFVDDLKFLDYKKNILRNIAHDAKTTFVFITVQKMDRVLEYILWVEDDIKSYINERYFVSSENCGGGYFDVNLKMEIKKYRDDVSHWNSFIDNHQYIIPLIPQEHQECFRKITPKW